jgi:hypothetical protein
MAGIHDAADGDAAAAGRPELTPMERVQQVRLPPPPYSSSRSLFLADAHRRLPGLAPVYDFPVAGGDSLVLWVRRPTRIAQAVGLVARLLPRLAICLPGRPCSLLDMLQNTRTRIGYVVLLCGLCRSHGFSPLPVLYTG